MTEKQNKIKDETECETVYERENKKEQKNPSYMLASCSVYVEDVPSFLKELANIGMKTGYHIVLIRSEYIAGKRHIETAITHAIRSFATKPIAKTLEIEVLLFAAATRQTGLIHPFGVQKGKNECYICLIPQVNELQMKPFDLLQEAHIAIEPLRSLDTPHINEKKDLLFFKENYNITSEELAIIGEERLEDLVCERVVLLSLLK